jgi:hypothetical protein
MEEVHNINSTSEKIILVIARRHDEAIPKSMAKT